MVKTNILLLGAAAVAIFLLSRSEGLTSLLGGTTTQVQDTRLQDVSRGGGRIEAPIVTPPVSPIVDFLDPREVTGFPDPAAPVKGEEPFLE